MSRVSLGRVAGPVGIKGWLRVQAFTRPPEAILQYRCWRIGDRDWEVCDGRLQGGAVVARLQGVEDREAAAALKGREVEVERSELPAAAPGEYYWADLVGCAVSNAAGVELGQVDRLFSNGAQDVLVVAGDRERLIPFVSPLLREVDLSGRRIVVDWEPEY